MATVLVIDDEPIILNFLRHAFREPELVLRTASSAAEGLAEFHRARPDVVIVDVHLGGRSGLETFRQIHALDRKVPVIFITGEGTAATAIEAMSLGAYEYLLKPLNLDQLRAAVFGALEVHRLMRVPAEVAEADQGDTPSDLLVGRSPAMQQVYKAIGRVARQDVTVLVLGESGTGKELIARSIYHYSDRAATPFLAINCAAIPEPLLESELFGHEKGAFTGAERRRIGKFEQCSGGTLFLDEIGDMTPLTQTKVLRVLQEQRFERVGGGETIQTDVRLIAATNRDLEQLVAEGRFRADLYYRLKVYTISLPPLRERADDLPPLVEHFLRRFSRELGKEAYGAAAETLDLLHRYSWPGNVRELQSVLKQALLHASGPVLLPEFVRPFLPEERGRPHSVEAPLHFGDLERFLRERLQAGATDLYAEWQLLTDRFLLTRVLQHTGGNLSQAARLLTIDRGTLRARLRVLDISTGSSHGGEERRPHTPAQDRFVNG